MTWTSFKTSSTTVMLAACLLLASCKPHQLAWVDDANAEKMVVRDTAQGTIRFFSVCGYSCYVPGVGSINAKRCYTKVAVQLIEGTGDAYSTNEDERLNVKAREFAEKYNLLVESRIKRAHQSQCDPATNWEKGYSALHEYVQSLNQNIREEGLVTLVDQRSEFNVTLPANVSFEQATPELCQRMAANGLIGVAAVKLSHRDQAAAGKTALHCTK